MAEILVFTENKINLTRTPEESTALLKRGDLVTIKENGAPWGRAESKQVFIAEGGDPSRWGTEARNPGGQLRFLPHPYHIIKVPTLTKQDVELLLQEEKRPTTPADKNHTAPDAEDRFIKVHQQVWRIDLDIVKPPEWAAGESTLTTRAFERAMDHKVDRTEFDHTRPDGKGRPRRV